MWIDGTHTTIKKTMATYWTCNGLEILVVDVLRPETNFSTLKKHTHSKHAYELFKQRVQDHQFIISESFIKRTACFED